MPSKADTPGSAVDILAGRAAAARYNPSDAMIERIHHPRMTRLPRLIRAHTRPPSAVPIALKTRAPSGSSGPS